MSEKNLGRWRVIDGNTKDWVTNMTFCAYFSFSF